MNKFLTLFLVVCSISALLAQDVKTLDGKSLGKRSAFIKGCAGAAEKKLMNIKGLEIEAEKYCACVCDELIPTIHSTDIEAAMKENKMKELFVEENNIDIILKCLDGNATIKDEFSYENIKDKETTKKIAIQSCIKEFLSSEDTKATWSEADAQKYCECAIDKLFSSGYTYKDLKQIEDENSKVFKEVVMPCVEEILKNENEVEEQGSKKK